MHVREKLKELTGKKYIYLTKRGNDSILQALKYAKEQGKTKVAIQNQGGWLTYKQYPKKLKMDLIELKTDYGLLDQELLPSLDDRTVLLINSMPGYCAYQEMREIQDFCKQKSILLINDATGSVGTKYAQTGDIIVGSFGKWKPVDLGKGGFIACDFNYGFQESELKGLDIKLDKLKQRLKGLWEISERIKHDFKEFKIIHKKFKGINVIIKFTNETEKNQIIQWCGQKGYEYTLCPRYIRVTEPAISIEVKRK